MKRKLATVVTALVLVCTMIVCLCACGSTWGKIKSAYEDAGYTETDSLGTYQESIDAALGDQAGSLTLHAMERKPESLLDVTNAAFVVVIEFKSTKDMKEFIDGNEEMKENLKDAYDDLQKSDQVNGNCLLLLPIGSDALTVFKGTK